MIKKINFSGYSNIPSPYDSADGALDLALNIIPENGALRPVIPPKVIRDIAPYDCLAIHNAGGKDWLILFLDSGGEVYASPAQGELSPLLIAEGFLSRPAVAVLGNTLAISDGKTTAYALYSADSGQYTFLGDAVPEISVSLALARKNENFFDTVTVGAPEGVSIDSLNSIFSAFSRGSRARDTYGRTGHNSEADILLDNITDAVYGILNKINTSAAEENTFIHPFLIRWALRLYDGSYIHQSAPVLMIPNSALPPLMYTASAEPPFFKFQIKTLLRQCSLLYRTSGLDALAPWADIVRSIDFFVSPPVYVYDQSGTIHAVHRTASESSVFSHSGAPVAVSSGSQTRSSFELPSDGGNHRHPSSSDDAPQSSFPEGNQESITSTSGYVFKPTVFSREHIEAGITSVSAFHLVASLPLFGNDAVQDLDAFAPLDLNDTALSTLHVRPTLPDDWRSHDRIHFTAAHAYNSRLALSGISSSVFSGFPIPDMAQYWNDPSTPDIQCTLWIKTVREFRTVWLSVPSLLQSGHLPRFLFYPDPAAIEMRIICADGSGWILPLKTHDFLNGAFWFDGLALERTPKAASVPVPAGPSTPDASLSISEPSKIFLSEVNNPFIFPVTCRVSVGSAAVLAISSASKALSQGQFGQFPLYAFTSEGIWALEISSSGLISARQPITRDICINPRAITQIDSAVLFPSRRGIMLLSGSSAECISDSISGPVASDIADMPGFETLLSLASLDHSDLCSPQVPFIDFLENSGIVYDYLHQRIIIFSPLHSVAYIFSLRSKLWGMTFARIAYAVASYPEALAVDLDGKLIDFSSESQSMRPAFIVTRPIKLDSPDQLKSIRALHIHGHFPSSAMRVALYASRNLDDWQLVASSDCARIVNRSGTPFRFFRLAIVAYLDAPRSISDAEFSFLPRFPNARF